MARTLTESRWYTHKQLLLDIVGCWENWFGQFFLRKQQHKQRKQLIEVALRIHWNAHNTHAPCLSLPWVCACAPLVRQQHFKHEIICREFMGFLSSFHFLLLSPLFIGHPRFFYIPFCVSRLHRFILEFFVSVFNYISFTSITFDSVTRLNVQKAKCCWICNTDIRWNEMECASLKFDLDQNSFFLRCKGIFKWEFFKKDKNLFWVIKSFLILFERKKSVGRILGSLSCVY